MNFIKQKADKYRGSDALFRFFGAFLIIFAVSAFQNPAKSDGVTVFAASSLAPALNTIITNYNAAAGQQKPVAIRAVYASSSTLAKQIAAGAPADIFFSAHPVWTDYLLRKNLLKIKSLKNLLSNRLVIAVPTDSKMKLENVSGLYNSLGNSRLAMGNPDHVPVGKYAKKVIENKGLWEKLKPKIAATSSARTALLLIERGEVGAGIVYKSDTVGRPGVKIIYRFSAPVMDKIVYPLSIIKNRDNHRVEKFYRYLISVKAAKVFADFGFQPLSDSR